MIGSHKGDVIDCEEQSRLDYPSVCAPVVTNGTDRYGKPYSGKVHRYRYAGYKNFMGCAVFRYEGLHG